MYRLQHPLRIWRQRVTSIDGGGDRVAVVIATVDRPDSLRRLCSALFAQTLKPVQIILSLPEGKSPPSDLAGDDRLQTVWGGKGLTTQRNTGIGEVVTDADVIAFFDDDAVPRQDYLAQAVSRFLREPGTVGLTGWVARDGAAEGRALHLEEIEQAMQASWSAEGAPAPADVHELYGCNMIIRADAVRATMFDPELPLYSWLEDLDFARRVESRGALKMAPECVAIHEGSDSGGRQQHRRFGYSSIANPLYLLRKGSLRLSDLPKLILRPLAANLAGGVVGQEAPWRRQRLVGMGAAVADLMRGRMHPGRMTQL